MKIVPLIKRDGSASALAIANCFDELQAQEGKVYWLYTPHQDSGKRFAFMTTNKDTHLGLGRMDDWALHCLGLYLESETKEGAECPVLLMHEKEERGAAWLVTRQTKGRFIVYHLAPAH